MPTFYLLGLGWANGWVLFESAYHLPAGYELGELFQNPQLTHNVPTGYIALCPQCIDLRTNITCLPSYLSEVPSERSETPARLWPSLVSSVLDLILPGTRSGVDSR